MQNQPTGGIGGVGTTYFTVNNSVFYADGENYTFGTGSIATFNHSAIHVENGLYIYGMTQFNATIGGGYGFFVTNVGHPAVFNISNQSTITLTNFITIGGTYPTPTGIGEVNVDDSVLSLSPPYGAYQIGSVSGTGNLHVVNAGQALGPTFYIGGLTPFYTGPQGTGVVTVSGTGSIVSASQLIAVGLDGSLVVSAGGKVTTPALNLSSGCTIGTTLDDPDAIAVSGRAILAGTLDVTLGNQPDPTLGQSFDLLTFASESGSFSTISLPPLDPGLSWSTSQLYINGTISVVAAVPEPAMACLLIGGAPSMLIRRRQRCYRLLRAH